MNTDGHWTCSACTFVNAPDIRSCEMCGTPGQGGGGKGGGGGSRGQSSAVDSRSGAWFSRITGFGEAEWRSQSKKGISARRDGNLEITNLKTGEKFNAGRFYEIKLGEVTNSLPPREKSDPVVFHIITRKDEVRLISLNSVQPFRHQQDSRRFVDVAYLQTLEENRGCVFQVASNFNGVEATSETSSPDSPTFTEKYIYDPTQGIASCTKQQKILNCSTGPAASISAGAAAIARVHAAFYEPDTSQNAWLQTRSKQVSVPPSQPPSTRDSQFSKRLIS